MDALNASTQRSLLEALFSPPKPSVALTSTTKSAGLTLMRHTIGQSDLTPSWIGEWSYDDTPNDVPDPSLQFFNVTEQGERMFHWLGRMADVAGNDTTLVGSVWSVPQWMKAANTLRSEFSESWVQYVTTYLEAAQRRGVSINAVTMQVRVWCQMFWFAISATWWCHQVICCVRHSCSE